MTAKRPRTNDPAQDIYFVSLGCPKNRVDTEVMVGLALRAGFGIAADPAEADIIVVNTCAFIGDAREESVNALLEMAQYKATGRCHTLVAAGCLSQRSAAELRAAMPELDALIGTVNPDEIVRAIQQPRRLSHLSQPGHFLPSAATPRFLSPGQVSAYVKIADGCSRRCAFCAIPGIRGKQGSRSVADIVSEVRQLGERGIREVVLVSQDTAAYGRDRRDGTDLCALLSALDAVDTVDWIRPMYLYPTEVSSALLATMARAQRILPYLDIPIQHAAPGVLKAMRRGHQPEALHQMLRRIRRHLPHAWLRTTVLVGHPGETDADIDALIAFMQEARFDHLGAFRYSPEADTAACDMPGQVRPVDSYRRWRKVMAAQRRIAAAQKRQRKGQVVPVLIEGLGDDDGFVLEGRCIGQAPEIDGVTWVLSCQAPPGSIVQGRIVRADAYNFVVEPV
ncbi:MAG: 30S ribosomal protein S12 methylthiotransferase RimO [Proteobacteria bacterium]|nr:30S ribosomal protein S12 methylthiotransferase RimO [Pseudomonadota bacterium]NLN63453.1 30S ribosomal protein S12 methylthiotransferase RimO [Myxococcales bacterium]